MVKDENDQKKKKKKKQTKNKKEDAAMALSKYKSQNNDQKFIEYYEQIN